MTLVEVLVAFALLALVSIAMFRVFAEGTKRTALARALQERMEIGQTVIAEALARGRFPSSSDGQAQGMRWFLEALPLEQARGTSPVPILLRLRIASPDGAPLLQTVAVGVPE